MMDGKKSNEDQRVRFIETARALGCDEDEAAFDEKLRQIVKHKPEPKAKAQPKKGEQD